MKAEELRLGNWVKLPGVQLTEYNQVESIDSHFYIDDNNSVELANGHAVSLIEGIPLTPEILEKAGFFYKYLSPKQHHYDNTIVVINTYKTKDAFYYESQLCDVEVNSVHQLQNLYFSLTGEELNITL